MSNPLQLTGASGLAAVRPLARLSFAQFAALFASLMCLALVPIAATELPPLFDYPNHLARMHILVALPSSPILRQYYASDWHPVPNLAMDAIVPVLARVMPVALAAKLFLAATLFLLAAGTATLHRAVVGAWSAWPCLAFLLLYNNFLLWGFINFLFGLGLALFAFAAWIGLSRRAPMVRFASGFVFALMVYFSHFLAFGLLGLMVTGFEAGRMWRAGISARRALEALSLIVACYLPPLLVLYFGSPATVTDIVGFGRFIRKFDFSFAIFDNYDRPFDIACFAAASVALGWAYWRGWIALAGTMVAPLVLLVVALFALPTHLLTAFGADHRVPLAMAFVLIAGTRWRAPARWPQYLFAAAALAMFLARLGIVGASWHASDNTYAALLPAIDELPVGSRVAVAFPPGSTHAETTPLIHFPALAAARRDAFVSTLFADPAQQPMTFQPPYAMLAKEAPAEALWARFVDGLPVPVRLDGYDYIAFVAPRPFTVPPRSGLELVAVTPRFVLMRVRH